MYVKYFKFKGKPFGLNPDPKFFFNSSTHKKALSCLGYGLGQGQGFAIITGKPGTGKTMLMSALLHMLEQTDIITARIINTQLESEDMLRYVAAELNLPFENLSKISLLKSIESFLKKCRSEGRRIVVIVDEAQNLSDSAIEELRMLMNLVSGHEKRLQFILLGQTSLQEKLYSEIFQPLRRRIVTSYQLEPFDEEETKAYVIHRLRTVGWVGNPDLSPGVYIAVQEYSGGVPAKINMLCEKLLQAACLNGSQVITEGDVVNIIHELNNHFSDTEFSGSLAEDIINALVKDKQQEKISVAQERVIPDVSKTVENDNEEIVLVDLNSGSELDNIPLMADQITVTEAMIEDNKLPSDEKLDEEIEGWLQQQKQRIKTSKQSQSRSEKSTHQPEEKYLTIEEPLPLFDKLSLDEWENTLENPPI